MGLAFSPSNIFLFADSDNVRLLVSKQNIPMTSSLSFYNKQLTVAHVKIVLKLIVNEGVNSIISTIKRRENTNIVCPLYY